MNTLYFTFSLLLFWPLHNTVLLFNNIYFFLFSPLVTTQIFQFVVLPLSLATNYSLTM